MQRHTIIIGGTSGSGRVLVQRLSDDENNTISILGRHPSRESSRSNVHFYTVDLLDMNIHSIINTVVENHGKITNLVFYQRFRGDGDPWAGEMQVSLTATKNIIETSKDLFDGSGNNSIVVISSIASHLIHTEQPVSYHVAKAGLNQMVRYYAVVLGPKGIRVNCILPSTVIKERNRQYFRDNPEARKSYEQIIPLRRMGTSEDIADAVEFLCSGKASFITGQEIVVDGGMSLVGQAPKQNISEKVK